MFSKCTDAELTITLVQTPDFPCCSLVTWRVTVTASTSRTSIFDTQRRTSGSVDACAAIRVLLIWKPDVLQDVYAKFVVVDHVKRQL